MDRRESSFRDPRFRGLDLVLQLQLAPSTGFREPLGGGLPPPSVSADAGRQHRVRGLGRRGYLVVVASSAATGAGAACLDLGLPPPRDGAADRQGMVVAVQLVAPSLVRRDERAVVPVP